MFYTFKIYKKRLFPYYKAIRGLNPSKKVYITKDNVSIYYKARSLLAPLIAEKNIMFLDTPTNSPDLHPIEHLYKDQKNILEDYRF